jgi:hypothetical protein
MNNKFYPIAGADVAPNVRVGLGRRFSLLVGAGASVLLLAACSSSGSSFGSAGASSTAATGNTDTNGGGNAVNGGADNSGGGDVVGPNAGSGPTGGSVGEGGTSANGGAAPSGGGASGSSPLGGGGAPAGGGGPGGGAGGGPPGPTCPKPAGQICHEFIANDNSRNAVHYVNEFDPTQNWTKQVGDTGQNSPRGIQIVDNASASTKKSVLVSIEHGFMEFDLVGGAQLSKVSLFSSVTSAVRIPNDGSPTKFAGATVLARDLNPPELDFVDGTGKSVGAAVKLPFAAAGTELRKLERNATTGNFTLTKYESATTAYIYEVSEQGALVNKIKLPAGGKGYNALWLANGNLMGTTGSLATVVTVTPAGAVVGTPLGGGKLKDSTGAAVYTDFFSGFYLLPNGNVVVANWLGHVDPATHPTTPELLEISPTNQLVWTWGNQSIATFITYGYMIR